jgi:hypothetical protein
MLLVIGISIASPTFSAMAEDPDTTETSSTISSSSTSTENEGGFTYNADFFASKTYNWPMGTTDNVSTLADVAKGWDQIQMFIQTIMDDKEIPGMIKDPTPEALRPTNGYIMCVRNHTNGDTRRDSTGVYRPAPTAYPAGTEMKVDYTQGYSAWGLPAGVDRTPYEDSPTAILVNLKSDYTKASSTTNNSTKQVVEDNIESMQVMTNRMRIEGNDNPGWLFNIRTPINKFFIMTKGKLRSTYQRPFHWMFEQLSPAEDSKTPTKVYDQMLKNNTFDILHDCKTAILKYHPTLMGAKDNTKDYVSSLLVFIPDKRFARLEAEQCNEVDTLGNVYRTNTQNTNKPVRYPTEDWTRDDLTSFIFYNPSYLPQMMFNTVNLEALGVELPSDNEDVQPGYSRVKLQWRSNISKLMEGTDCVEVFRVFRVINGEKQPICWVNIDDLSELTAVNPERDTVFADKEYISIFHACRETGEVTMYVREPLMASSYQVEYVVEGAVKDTDISDVESNTVTVTIPGRSPLDRCELNMVGNHTSQFVIEDDAEGNAADYNHYVHNLGLTNSVNSRYPLLAGHINNNLGDDHGKCYFTLCQGESLDDINILADNLDEISVDQLLRNNEVAVVQRLYITDKEDREDGYTYYKGYILDMNSQQILSEGAYFKALTADGDNAMLEPTATDAVWFKVVFDAATKGNLHPSNYYYRIFSNIGVRAQDSDELSYASSTIVNFAIPHSAIATSFNSYSEDEIRNDCHRVLPTSKKEVRYRVNDDVNVETYTVVHTKDMQTSRLAVARRSQNGKYTQVLYSNDEMCMAIADDEDASNQPSDIDCGVQRFAMTPYAAEGGTIVCQLSDFNGNTYGTARANVPSTIPLEGGINNVELADGMYLMTANWNVNLTDENFEHIIDSALFNVWAVSDTYEVDPTEASFWDDHYDITHALNINDMFLEEDNNNIDGYSVDGAYSELSYAYNPPVMAIDDDETADAAPFVASIMVRYYPQVVADSLDETDGSEEATVQYAVVELPATYVRYSNPTVSRIDDVTAAEGPTEICIYSVQGIELARYNSNASTLRSALKSSGLPAGVYIARIGDRVLKVRLN